MSKNISFVLVAILATLLTQAQQFEEIQKLLGSDANSNDEFGKSVSISFDYAIVGVPFDDDNYCNNSGAAYIYYNNNGIWEQVVKLTAPDPSDDQGFGYSVSISGDYAIVGAPWGDDNGNNSGVAYIFYNNYGLWQEWGKLVPSDGIPQDYFGHSVNISGDYAIVGAYNNNDNGSAYVFYNNIGVWQQHAKFTASDGAIDDRFGYAVGISGDYAIVGAYQDDDNGINSGSAYIFYKNLSIWQQWAKLTGSDGAEEDGFGNSVSISGDYIIVGTPYDDNNNESNSGSAYIFHNNTNIWQELTKLMASDADQLDSFGCSVNLSGDYAVIGAIGNDDNGILSGSAYVFHNNNNIWEQLSKLTASDGTGSDYFGYSVDISGDYALVGAIGDYEEGIKSGSAYIFGSLVPIIVIHPVNQSNVCINSTVFFAITAEYATNYQWQVSTDNGNSFTDISDGGPYSGTQTDSLMVTVIPPIDDHQYRCTVSNTSGTTNSNAAIINIDIENPEIICVNNGVRYTDETNHYVVNGTEFDPVWTNDNCGIASVTNNYNQTSTLEGEQLPEGEIVIYWTIEDNAGNNSDCSFTVSINSYNSIEDFKRAGINIFPNPTNGKIHFEFGDNHIQQLKIYDITGKTIIDKTEIQQEESIDLSLFKVGIYIIRIQTDKAVLTTKILKE